MKNLVKFLGSALITIAILSSSAVLTIAFVNNWHPLIKVITILVIGIESVWLMGMIYDKIDEEG